MADRHRTSHVYSGANSAQFGPVQDGLPQRQSSIEGRTVPLLSMKMREDLRPSGRAAASSSEPPLWPDPRRGASTLLWTSSRTLQHRLLGLELRIDV